jgi:malate synthase
MEDAATAEISRGQIWQWVQHGARLAGEGPWVTPALVRLLADEEMETIRHAVGDEAFRQGRFDEALRLFEQVALSEEFPEFLTIPAYAHIE